MSIFPQGMDSGFAGGEDEIYNVYDQAWRGGKDMAQNIYRPSKNLDKDMYGDDLEARIKTNRYQGRLLSFNIHTSENKVVHSHFSFSLDLFPIRSFLVQTVDKEAEKDQFSLRRILLVWTNFWKKPSNTVALKDPQIAAVPRNMSMKAKRGGRSRYFVQSERTVIDNPNDASHMGNTLYMARIKTKSGCQSPALLFITGVGGGYGKVLL